MKMHDCDSILTQLSLQLDHQLGREEMNALQAEIAGCAQCQALVQTMQQADALLRAQPMIEPALNLSLAVMKRIEQREAREKQLLGLTLLVGGIMSLWPTLLFFFSLLVLMLASINPGVLNMVVEVIIMSVGAIRTIFLALATIQETISPWVAPSVAATLGLVLLTFAVIWAQRHSLDPHDYVKA